jgi:hypothetical protein
VTHALITHCQRGHFDHLDRAGKHFLRERRIPVFCTPHDAPYLRARGLNVQPLSSVERAHFFHGHISAIPCVHGEGWVGRVMEHGVGYLEALDHCPTTREELRAAAQQAGLAHKLLVPADGERCHWPRAA